MRSARQWLYMNHHTVIALITDDEPEVTSFTHAIAMVAWQQQAGCNAQLLEQPQNLGDAEED